MTPDDRPNLALMFAICNDNAAIWHIQMPKDMAWDGGEGFETISFPGEQVRLVSDTGAEFYLDDPFSSVELASGYEQHFIREVDHRGYLGREYQVKLPAIEQAITFGV